MSVHYDTITIRELSRREGDPVTVSIEVAGKPHTVEMPEDEWRTIARDWADHYDKLELEEMTDMPPERPRPPGPPPPRPSGLPEAPQHGDARARRARDEALTSFLDALRGPLAALVTDCRTVAVDWLREHDAARDDAWPLGGGGTEGSWAQRVVAQAREGAREEMRGKLDDEISDLILELESPGNVAEATERLNTQIDALQTLRYKVYGSPLTFDTVDTRRDDKA